MHACMLSHFSCVQLCATPWSAAQQALGIEYDKLEAAIRRVFGRKGEAIVDANIKALAIGRQAQK